MVDRVRVLTKIDELKGYLTELQATVPPSFELYTRQTKRACERLLQLCIEATIDISKKLVIGHRLGIPKDEADLFEKLKTAGVLSPGMLDVLKRMRGLRNVLVHEYADIQDQQIFETITNRLGDFEIFIQEVLAHLGKR